jgi:hypothetical protein
VSSHTQVLVLICTLSPCLYIGKRGGGADSLIERERRGVYVHTRQSCVTDACHVKNAIMHTCE